MNKPLKLPCACWSMGIDRDLVLATTQLTEADLAPLSLQ